MTFAHVGLGSNRGDRRRYLAEALAALDATDGLCVDAVSRLYETAHLGVGPRQASYLNAVVRLGTERGPSGLLTVLRDLESAAGRHEKGLGRPRTLDLDLLLFGDAVVFAPGLEVPHPRLAARRFVLAPLADLDPGCVVPGIGRTVAELLTDPDVAAQDVAMVASGRWWDGVTV